MSFSGNISPFTQSEIAFMCLYSSWPFDWPNLSGFTFYPVTDIEYISKSEQLQCLQHLDFLVLLDQKTYSTQERLRRMNTFVTAAGLTM